VFVRKRFDLYSVLFFLLTVAYFVAAAKGLGHGHPGTGFFNGGMEAIATRVWP
jgi:hypothetical protein